MIYLTPRPILHTKEPWGVPRASPSFSETQSLPGSFTRLTSFPLSPPPSQFPSPQPKSLSCVTSSLAPFSTFHTATSVPVPFVFCSKLSGGSSGSLRQGMQGWLARTDLFQPCHRHSFAQTLLVARLVVPEHTGFSGLPLCLSTCHSFDPF